MASEYRQFAQTVLDTEAGAISQIQLGDGFDAAVRLVLDCPTSVLTSGIGKAGHVARKLSASFSSTGTPSHFLNPAEAVHGDLGSVRRGDVVVILSYSGESDEIVRVLSVLKKLGNPVIAITASRANSLGRFADATLELGKIEEACPLRLAPSASTTAMLALGDALCLTVMKHRAFTADDFALYHPAGQLGRKLIKVREAMGFRTGENLPVASDRLTVGQVLHEVSTIKRRSGAVVLVDDQGRVSGIFSDGDLRRLLTDDADDAAAGTSAGGGGGATGSVLRRPMRDVMTRNPKRIHGDKLASEAIAVMRPHRIDDLPVVDDDDKPIGLIDIQDLVVLKMLDVDGN
jgi:arabinose-5-phosphate isomerase